MTATWADARAAVHRAQQARIDRAPDADTAAAIAARAVAEAQAASPLWARILIAVTGRRA